MRPLSSVVEQGHAGRGRVARGAAAGSDASDLADTLDGTILEGTGAVDMGRPANGANGFYEVKGRVGAELFASCIGMHA